MGRVSTCQKNCNTIDLRRAQVNEALGYVFSSGVQPLRYEDVNPPHMWMTARESSAGNPYDNLPNSGSATGNSFDNASYDNV